MNGEWVDRATHITVTNPSTGVTLANVPDCSGADASAAIEAATIAQKDWARRTGKDRAQILRRWYDLMVENADDLAAILTAENGQTAR